MIQMDNLISLAENVAPPQLYHYNRFLSATVSAGLAKGKTIGQGLDEMDRIADETLGDDFRTALAGDSKEFRESSSSLMFAFILAVMLIYLILAAQFESFKDPLVIMLTVPLAIAGALVFMWGADQTMNIFSQIGIIMLIGLVAKNGILIVEFANQKQEAGLDKMRTIEEGNASNDIPTCATIVNGFVSSEVDLIMANATPALQAAVAATNTIPILGTSVTEYGVALSISDFSGTVGGNVSGTSDLAPLDQQAAMVKELFPDAKTVGILYCSGEANSVYQANVVKECLEADGLTVNIFTFADSNDVSTVTTSAVAESDVLYIPTDNTAASCTEAIAAVTVPAGVPVIAGEEGICKGCGLATLSINYYDLGRTTGEMAVKILKGEADISEMPVEYFQGPVKKFNKDMAEKLNVTIPDEYVAIED